MIRLILNKKKNQKKLKLKIKNGYVLKKNQRKKLNNTNYNKKLIKMKILFYKKLVLTRYSEQEEF